MRKILAIIVGKKIFKVNLEKIKKIEIKDRNQSGDIYRL